MLPKFSAADRMNERPLATVPIPRGSRVGRQSWARSACRNQSRWVTENLARLELDPAAMRRRYTLSSVPAVLGKSRRTPVLAGPRLQEVPDVADRVLLTACLRAGPRHDAQSGDDGRTWDSWGSCLL